MNFSGTTLAHPDYVQPITSSPGIYFDYIGQLKIRRTFLDTMIPIDTSYIGPHIENINSILGTARYLCKQTEALNNLECHSMLEPLTARYHDIVKEFDSISHLMPKSNKRSAWFGGVGTVFKHIFGTLDEEDAIKYDQAVETVISNQKELASLMKQNMLVTTSSLLSYNKTLHEMKINEARLNDAIDNLSVNIRNLNNATDSLLVITNINSILSSLESTLLTLSFRLEDITNSIAFSSKNVLHSSVITPYQLYRELADSYIHLNNDVELPVNLELDSMYNLVKLSKILCYYINRKIIFILRIPLVAPIDYSLYHNVALPIPHNPENPNTYITVIPSSKYTAVTKDKQNYCNLSDLEKCNTIDNRNYICEVISIFSMSEYPTCESELLSKVSKKIPVQCETKFIYGNLRIWKALVNNRWIYIHSVPTQLSIDCNKQPENTVTLLGTGIVSLPNYCTAFSSSVRLIPIRNSLINISIAPVSSDFDLINDSCCNENKIKQLLLLNNVSPISLINADLDNIDINNQISNSLLNQVDKIINQPHIIKYGTHYSIFTILLIIFTFIFITYKLYKYIIDNKLICSYKKKENPEQSVQVELSDDISTSLPRIRIN